MATYAYEFMEMSAVAEQAKGGWTRTIFTKYVECSSVMEKDCDSCEVLHCT